ncbi:secreted protein [Streptomyces sp. BK205]|nr:secreted protein [Streptomyces sp. BK205]
MSAAGSADHHEIAYDRRRLRQWLAGEARAEGVTRRRLLTLLAATAAATGLPAPEPARAADPTIVKPLPPAWFIPRGTNAETRWEALRGTGHHTPNELFFVRNHTATPVLDADDWRLRLWGDGLRGTPGEDRPVEFG